MQKSEPRFVERVIGTFYKVMRQIYVEQVWRKNGKSSDESVVIQRSIEDRTGSQFGPPFSHSLTHCRDLRRFACHRLCSAVDSILRLVDAV
jgi:hypothetical protein